jgi:hypothetical protein
MRANPFDTSLGPRARDTSPVKKACAACSKLGNDGESSPTRCPLPSALVVWFPVVLTSYTVCGHSSRGVLYRARLGSR